MISQTQSRIDLNLRDFPGPATYKTQKMLSKSYSSVDFKTGRNRPILNND